MSFGPACERCGCCSYEGSMDDQPVRCPFCSKPKRRGSREELVEHFNRMVRGLDQLLGHEYVEIPPQLRKLLSELLRDAGDL